MDNIDRSDKRSNSSRETVRKTTLAMKTGAAAAPSASLLAELVKIKDDVSNIETTTVTTVPKKHQKQEQKSSSLLNSSPSALAKFNRIIDSTMPATDCYQRYQEQSKRGIVTTFDSEKNRKIDFTTSTYDDDVGLDVEIDDNGIVASVVEQENDDEILGTTTADYNLDDDNQMKRNDVHYLLKQLNSFSDIEEIEIVDMKQRRQQHKQQQEALPTTTPTTAVAAAVITHSPTATSLVIISPSSQSHKESRHMMRRFASLHQQQSEQYSQHHQQRPNQRKRCYTLNASGGNLLELGSRFDTSIDPQYLLQQFDDYLFESCHYLETNYFAATYRTAMIESSSHEFRPSTTTGTRSSPSAPSSPHSYEIHEVELPSVICRAPPPPPSPTRRFHTQARLTNSGVQTELTASSLSSTTTTTPSAAAGAAGALSSMAKSTSRSSGTSACSTSCTSSTEQRRRMPFFKCCYAPIDRWREKRSAAAATSGCQASTSHGQHQKAHSSGSSVKRRADGTNEATKTTAATATKAEERGGSPQRQKQPQQQTQEKQHSQRRKNGSAV